ncbi:hypothetical protein E2C01_072245 [Portunus trituberculatus]|uniref:Uncharacterized protein n=1 Tax=Portunus trituberculatus TaxID=210409 RepID=A0A5B7I795_PORTR|nr:hypothetical protein [Portunus trituberculatus]
MREARDSEITFLLLYVTDRRSGETLKRLGFERRIKECFPFLAVLQLSQEEGSARNEDQGPQARKGWRKNRNVAAMVWRRRAGASVRVGGLFWPRVCGSGSRKCEVDMKGVSEKVVCYIRSASRG